MTKISHHQPTPHILIVDDDRLSTALVSAMIKRFNVAILTASSAPEALAIIQKKPALALAIIDIFIPDSSGFEIAGMLAKEFGNMQIPVIFITARSEDKDLLPLVYAAGGVDHLYKPIEPYMLASKVNIFLKLFEQRNALERKSSELIRANKNLHSFNIDLQSSEERFANLFHNLSEAAFWYDYNSGKILRYNSALSRLLGTDSIPELKHLLNPVLKNASDEEKNCLKNGLPANNYLQLRTLKGQKIHLLYSCSRSISDRQHTWQFILQDITFRVREERKKKWAMRQEKKFCTKIQQTLLLAPPPADVSGIDIAATSIPSKEVDGDFYDFHHSAQCSLGIVIGDVMGKGFPAAMLSAATKNYLLKSLFGLIVAEEALPDPESIIQKLHFLMTQELIDLDSFVTICFARIYLEQRRIAIVDCGHQPVIHFCANSGKCEYLKGDNTPIGFLATETYKQFYRTIGAGDLLCFYSDGITEARNHEGELFGTDRLGRLIREMPDKSSEEILQKIISNLQAYTGSNNFEDDLTCIVVKINYLPDQIKPRTQTFKTHSHLGELKNIRHFIRQFTRTGLVRVVSTARLVEMELAANEAAANIFKHAYHGKIGMPVHVTAEDHPDKIILIFKDWGIPFDLDQVKAPHLDKLFESGLGLYMIRKTADKIEYKSHGNGTNSMTLAFKKNKSTD